MATHRTTNKIMDAIKEIDPLLCLLYEVTPLEDGVKLKRGETTIISRTGTYGAVEGLYEVFPRIHGQGMREILGTSSDISGWLTLKEAVRITETICVYSLVAKECPLLRSELEVQLKSHFES